MAGGLCTSSRMAQQHPTAGAVAGDPLWLAHRYDPVGDSVHFVPVSRDEHRAATFLTDEYLGDRTPVPVARAEAVLNAGPAAPIHFILHSAFCCSTLLARAFDIEGISMGLKEPVILNDLVGWRHRGGEPRRVGAVLGDALTLLARPFSAGEAVIVKPSNLVNGFAPAIMSLRPGAHALLLEAPLRTYLGSVAKKGMWGRLWVRDLLAKQLKEGLVDLGFSPDDYFGQTDLQVAGVGWLAQHALFARLAAQFGPERVKTLDSEMLVARPAETMAETARLFGLSIGTSAIAAIATGPVFKRHSKFGGSFGAAERAAEHSAAALIHADEIEKVAIWIEAVADRLGLPMTIAAPLLRG